MRTKGIDVKNSCNITQEERNAFMERFKTVCRQRGTTVAAMQIKLGKANAYFRNMGYISEFIGEEIKEYIPDINIEYVNEGIGEPFISGIPRKKIEKEIKPIAQVKQVPLLSTAAHGGSLIGFHDANNIQCEMIMSPVSNADIALYIVDESIDILTIGLIGLDGLKVIYLFSEVLPYVSSKNIISFAYKHLGDT